jgi:predicted CoA-binding protein
MDSGNKKTVILGASPNPARFSYLAANLLHRKGYDIVPIGIKKGTSAGKDILDIRKRPFIENVHTITLYMNPGNQVPYYDYILQLKPERVIFNPGTENKDLEKLARSRQIEVVSNCTLVMLNSGSY